MKNDYQIIAKSVQANAKNVTHEVPVPGSFWGPLKIKAAPGVGYQLVDLTTGKGPDNIRVKRVGKDLRISFEGRENVDAMIIGYYEYLGNEGLIGESESGAFHVYVPESGDSVELLGRLTDGANSTGMALGQAQWMASSSSGAAVGALVGVAAFNPLLAAPLALLAAAGAAGGGGDKNPGADTPADTGGDVDKPAVRSARLKPADDTGVSNSDGITNINKPRLLVDADPGAVEAVVTLNGKEYTSTDKNGQGQFVVPITDTLANGVYTYTVKVKNAAGILGPEFAGTPFTVDTSGTDDFPPNENSAANQNVAVQIISISEDTGASRNDFVTSDNTLVFNGTVGDTFNNNIQNFVEVKLLNSAQQLVTAPKYIRPELIDGAFKWTWDNASQTLADGTYTLTAQIVDTAGNPVSQAPVNQAIVVDTNANLDPNAAFPVVISRLVQDSGVSPSDYLTNQRGLTFEGNIGNTNVGGFTGKVLVQVLGADGKIISQNYLDPDASGNWSFDNTSKILGVPNNNTQYVLKASVVDLAGNMMKSTDQSFTVDLKESELFFFGGAEDTNKVRTFKEIGFTATEPGTFSYSNPTAFAVDGQIKVFAPNTLTINFTDRAGNVKSLSNPTEWRFELDTAVKEVIPTTSPPPSTFGSGELAGSIGRLDFGDSLQTLDLSSLYSKSPTIGGVAAINHVVMTDGVGNDTLQLSTADVLQLGVKNSFLSNGRQQMRIDGDLGDRVELDKFLGGSSFPWEKASSSVALNALNYDIYTNDALNLQLLIQEGINTQVL